MRFRYGIGPPNNSLNKGAKGTENPLCALLFWTFYEGRDILSYRKTRIYLSPFAACSRRRLFRVQTFPVAGRCHWYVVFTRFTMLFTDGRFFIRAMAGVLHTPMTYGADGIVFA